MKFTDNVKRLVRERTGMVCDRCGVRAPRPHYHHRRPRGMGGSSSAASGLPSNALLLHPSCHEWIERNRSYAKSMGWIVSSWDIPNEVPVFLHGEWALLTDDGSVTVCLAADWSGRGSLPVSGIVLPHDEVADVDSASASHPAEGVPSTRPF